MNGMKTMLLGIALILFGIAASTMNFIGWGCGAGGLLLTIIGLLREDKSGDG